MGTAKKWLPHIVLILGLIILPIAAIYVNGAKAWSGITWGMFKSEDQLPAIKIHSFDISYGVYDHNQTFTHAEGLAFEHLYY